MNRLARNCSAFVAFSTPRDLLRKTPLASLALFTSMFVSPAAFAADDAAAAGAAPAVESAAKNASEPANPRLGMDPASPNAAPLPGGTLPTDVNQSSGAGDWRFGFHGFLTMPLNIGLNERQNPGPGQSASTLHIPPLVPADQETFSYTGVVPLPYTQLNFSYGNNIVTANVHLLAKQASVSMGYFDPPSQAGINDAYFTVHPDLGRSVAMRMHFGAFSTRYGTAGEYDQGRYGTPMIFKINGVGEQITADFALNKDFMLSLEQGVHGQTNKAAPDMTPDVWNGFADPNAGSSLATHWHAGVNYAGVASLGLHYASVFSNDDKATGTLAPDGKVGVLGADLRLTMGRFGHLYVAASQTTASDSKTVGRIIEILNAQGGKGLIDEYLGDQSGGTGKLSVVGAQYDLSIGRLVSYPTPFYGDGPDIFVSLFGMGVNVESDDPRANDVGKMKIGAEATYSLLSWLAASFRLDQVHPNLNETRYSFVSLAPRVIFRTDWQSSDQLVLQYSRWLHGSMTTTRTGAPPEVDPSVKPDSDVISLSASMWW